MAKAIGLVEKVPTQREARYHRHQRQTCEIRCEERYCEDYESRHQLSCMGRFAPQTRCATSTADAALLSLTYSEDQRELSALFMPERSICTRSSCCSSSRNSGRTWGP